MSKTADDLDAVFSQEFKERPPEPRSNDLDSLFRQEFAATPSFDTALSPQEESRFKSWKARYAPKDSGEDYDLRGAFKAGLAPDPVTGHWPDTFKKPNHPTFSNESQYAVGEYAAKAGRWTGPNRDQFVPAGAAGPDRPYGTAIGPGERGRPPRTPTAESSRRGAAPPVPAQPLPPDTTTPEQPLPAELTQPISKTIGGKTFAETADQILPKQPIVGASGYARELNRFGLQTVAGVLDWMQTPLGIATAIAHATTEGADAVILPILGPKFTKDAYDGAKAAVESMIKDGPSVENVERLVSSGLMAAGAIAGGKRPEILKPEAELRRNVTGAQSIQEPIMTRAKAVAQEEPPMNQSARRATLEVPETTVPEEQYFSDAELEELTRPDTKPPIPAQQATAPRPPERIVAPPVAEAAAPPPEIAPPVQPGPQAPTIIAIPETPAPEIAAESAPDGAPKREATLQSFHADLGALRQHEARGGAADVAGGKDYANYDERLAQAAEKVPDSAVADYLDKLRDAATVHHPDAIEAVGRAQAALANGDRKTFAAEAEQARAGMREEYGRRLAESEAARLGLELPKPQPKPRAVKPEALARTAREQFIRDGAESEMQAWAEGARAAQGQQKRGESAMTMESNAAGKEIEEEQGRHATSIHSLGAKEGSPIAGFEETPADIISAIDDQGGRLKDSKKAALYARIQKAFREAYEDSHGEAIDTYLDNAPDEQRRDLFGAGADTGALNFEEGQTPSDLGRTEQEGMRRLAAGRKVEQLREGKQFDENRLVASPLFGGRGGAQDFLSTDERAALRADEGDTSFNFGDEKGHSPILDDAVHKLSDAVDQVREYVTIDAIPQLSKAGVQQEAVAHASTRTAVPRIISDMLSRVFPENYKNPAEMARAMRIMVLDNILGGYDDLKSGAEFARERDDEATAKRLDKRAEAVAQKHDLEAYHQEVTAAMNDDMIRPAIQRWKKIVNPEMDRLYNEMKGMDPNTPRDGRGRVFGARVNLLANSYTPEWLKAVTNEDEPVPQQPSPNLSSYRNPNVRRDRFDRMAKFTAAEYSDDPVAVLASALFPRWNEVTKRRLYNKLVDTGWAAWEKPEGGKIQGQEVRGAPVQTPETIHGETRNVAHTLWLPKGLHEEFRGVLGTDLPLKANPVSAMLTKLQLAQFADATSHLKNIHSVIAGAQGTQSLLADVGRKLPGISSLDSFMRIGKVMYDITQDKPAIRTELAQMAKAGMLRQKFPATGIQRFTKMQDIIHSVDTASRVVMNRFYDNLADRGLAADNFKSRRAFVQQIGEYNKRLMGPLMRAASQGGLSPFIVAGRNFNRYSRRLLTGAPGFEPASRAAALQSRLVEFTTLGAMFALPAMLNKLSSGSIAGRAGTPVGAIDLGLPEDERGNHKVLDLLQLYGIRRGMRAIGLEALATGLKNGDSPNDIAGKAIYDAIGTAAHPWLGPALGFGVAATTGQRLDLRGGPMPEQAAKMEGMGSQFLENSRVALKNQNVILYDLSGARTASGDTDESFVKDFANDFLKSPASAVGISDRPTPAMQAARDAATHVQTTPEQKERAQLRRQILAAYDANDPKTAEQLRAKGKLSPADSSEINRERRMSPIERATWREPLETVLNVWEKATPEEKVILRRVISRKVSNASPVTPGLVRAQSILWAPIR